MINPTKRIEITATYAPPFIRYAYGYYNTDFYVSIRSLGHMFKNKYDVSYYRSILHPFKVVILQ